MSEPQQKQSLTGDVWKKVEADAGESRCISLSKLMPHWNEANKIVYGKGKEVGFAEAPKPTVQLVPKRIEVVVPNVDAQIEILELIVQDMKNRGQNWTSGLAQKPSTL